LFIIVFSGDTGAYFGGRLMGRHKLAPTISPKKTVEGTVFGLTSSVGGAFLAATYLVPQLDATEVLVMGLLCGMVAQVGDLAESLFKRAMDTKDSGRILPGHGGMLDRIDGVLFAAPVFFAWLHLG
jgi:phosphatidate cytidylyltransferase